MAFQGPLGGTAFLKIDDKQVQLKGSLMYEPGGLEATGVAGMDGVHGYTEKFGIPSIEMDISDSGGVSLIQLKAIRNATVTAELNNGKTIVLRGAWCAGAVQGDAVQAQTKVKFEGLSMNEIGVKS